MAARLVILTILASIGFFNYHAMFPLAAQRAMFMLMVVICAIYGYKQDDVKLSECKYPRLPWFIFGCCMVVSMFMAPIYHPQSISASIISHSTTLVVYGSFFVLLKLNPDPQQLLKYLFIICGIGCLVYFINFITFPANMFGETIKLDLSRGMLRISIPLFLALRLLMFYSINQWQDSGKKKWLVYVGFGAVMVVLSLTRQAIAIMGVLCFLQILQKVSWTKKIIIGVTLASVAYGIFINIPIYQEMKDLSEQQLDDNMSDDKEDVRIGAWRYYAYEANEELTTFIFGNGTPAVGKSVWGKRLDAYSDETGFLLGDVAWAAVVYQYGIVATVSLLVIVFMSIFKRKRRDQQYLTYFMVSSLLFGIASGVWYYTEEIFINMIALYLIYRPGDEEPADAKVELQQSKQKTVRQFVVE